MPPTCYWHPDRETYVRCTRCDRPICPEDMIPASVGFQCPDDVRAGARTIRPTRTSLGGRVQLDASRITMILIAINVIVFAAGFAVPGLVGRFANVAQGVDSDGQLVGVADGEVFRLLTAAFLHGGWLHLLVNMLALFTIGPQLEAALGRGRYLTLYLLSALGGSVAGFVFSPPTTYSVGASGAVFGLFGAFYLVVRRLGGDTGQIAVLLIINLVITFTIPNIDARAHLGGLATGAVLAAAFAYAPQARRDVVAVAASLAVAVLLLVAVLTRSAALG